MDKIRNSSKWYYNLGLEKAKEGDLSGAMKHLKTALYFDKYFIDARNLLGLIYYQIGETVPALSQWVISTNFEKSNNGASDYLKAIRDNPTELDRINQVVKKYNQALTFAHQGNEDLALIQLKQVVSLNPNFINAQLLIALLAIKDGKGQVAQEALDAVLAIDTKNPKALEYMREVYTEASKTPETNNTETETEGQVQKGKPTMISNFEEKPSNKKFLGYLLVGLVIGVVVTLVLLYPSIRSTMSNSYNSKINDYKEQIMAKDLQIKANEKKVKTAEAEKKKAEAEVKEYKGSGKQDGIFDNLLDAMQSYNDGDSTAAAEVLLDIDRDKLTTKKQKSIYDDLAEKTFPTAASGLYSDGLTAYNQGQYKDAISYLKKAIKLDDQSVEYYYYLARSYEKNDDKSKAIKEYKKLIKNFPGTNSAANSETRLQELDSSSTTEKKTL